MTVAATSDARYEFRCWPERADRLRGAIERRYRFSLMDARDDVYFLTEDESLLPKLRSERRFEIKRLLIRAGALERWTVALSEEFPLSDRAADIIDAEFQAPIAGRALMTPRGLEASLARVSQVRYVRKVRGLYEGDQLRCEFTTVFVDPSCLQSVAFEADEKEPIFDAIAALGLEDEENVHYGRKLRALEGRGGRRTFGRVAH